MKAEPKFWAFSLPATGSGGVGGPVKGAECGVQAPTVQEIGPGQG